MTTLDDIAVLLTAIKDELPALIRNTRIGAAQVSVVSGLSDISEQLGLMQAGEFRSGNGMEPGFGFTGGRFGYPGFVYGGETYFLAGVQVDILQIGLRIEDGTLVFGTGTGKLDGSGIKIISEGNESDNNGYKFVAADGVTVVSGLYSIYDTLNGHNYLHLRNVYTNIMSGEIFIDGIANYYARVHLTVDSNQNSGAVGTFSLNQTDTDTYIETTGLKDIALSANISGTERIVHIHEDPGTAGVLMMDMEIPTAGSKFAIGGDVVLWGGRNGVTTVFNGNNFNIDFNIQGQTDWDLMRADASLDAVGFGVIPPSANFKVFVTGGIFTDGVRSRGASLADDAAISDTPARPNGLIIMGTNGDATTWGLVYYNTATPQTIALNVGSNLNVSTGALTGTTGVDTKMTVSAHTDGKIYFENRRGVARTIYALYI